MNVEQSSEGGLAGCSGELISRNDLTIESMLAKLDQIPYEEFIKDANSMRFKVSYNFHPLIADFRGKILSS